MKNRLSSNTVVTVILGRKILSQMLTIYLPSTLIIIVVYSTNFLKEFFFEAIVSVNLTAMLVLTTIFLGVSGDLPTTSYIKYVELWLLFCLFVPFIYVLLHIYIDSLRVRKKYTNLEYCHTRLHLGFSAKLRISQVPTCKMEQRSGYISCNNPPTCPPTRRVSLEA